MGNRKKKSRNNKSNAAKVRFRFPNAQPSTSTTDKKRKNISDISFTDSDNSGVVQDSNRIKLDLSNTSSMNVSGSTTGNVDLNVPPTVVVTPASPQVNGPTSASSVQQVLSQPQQNDTQSAALSSATVSPQQTGGAQPTAPPPTGSTQPAVPPSSGSAQPSTPPPTGSAQPAAPSPTGNAQPAAPPPTGGTQPATGAPGTQQSGAPHNLTEEDRFALAMLATLKREEVGETLTGFFETAVLKVIAELRETDKAEISELKQENAALRAQLNTLEQYSRRNSIRITNPYWREHPYENTDSLVMELVEKLGIYDFPPWLIDRSHRVGKHKTGRQRDILVKFVGYRPKEAIMNARNKAGNSSMFNGVYVNEDLSKETSLLYFKARSLKKSGKLSSATTRDGRVLVSRFVGDPLAVVNNEEDLHKIASRGTFSNAVSRDPPTEPIQNRLLKEAGMHPVRERKHAPPQSKPTPKLPGFQRRPASAGPKNSQQRRSSSVGTPRAPLRGAGPFTPAAQTRSGSGGSSNIPAPQSSSTPDTGGQPVGDPGGNTASNEWSFDTY